MSRQRRAAAVRQDQAFKARQFTAEVILWAVRWYLMFPISYRDLELMLLDRSVKVDHTSIFRWIQAYAAELEKQIRPGGRQAADVASGTCHPSPPAAGSTPANTRSWRWASGAEQVVILELSSRTR
jgi:hypothetical protein